MIGENFVEFRGTLTKPPHTGTSKHGPYAFCLLSLPIPLSRWKRKDAPEQKQRTIKVTVTCFGKNAQLLIDAELQAGDVLSGTGYIDRTKNRHLESWELQIRAQRIDIESRADDLPW